MADTKLLLSRAKSAVLARDYDIAARIYKQLLAENPVDVILLQDLGSTYIKSGDDAAALVEYEKIIELQPANVGALTAMGGIYRRLKRYDESVAVLEKARTLDNRNLQVSYNLGFTYKTMGDFDRAIACFEDVIDQNPSDVLTYNHIGAIYAEQGEFDKAIASYQRGLKIDANHPILLLNLAKSYTAVGELDKAIASYEGSLRSKPGWKEAIEEYSDLLLQTDHVREAYDVLRNALQLNPTNAKMHTQLGQVYTRQSIFEDAKKEYKAALEFQEDYDPALLGLANAHENLDEHEEAVKTIQRAEALHPDNVEIKQQAAHILLSANEYAAAFERISELREQNPDDVQSLSLLGQYYICNGDWDKVEECYEQIASYDPTDTSHLKDGAKRFQQKGDDANAEKYLRKAIDANPKDAGAMVSLASLLENQSQGDAALKLYQQANAIDKQNLRSKNGIRRLQTTTDDDIVAEVASAPIAVVVPVAAPAPQAAVAEQAAPAPVAAPAPAQSPATATGAQSSTATLTVTAAGHDTAVKVLTTVVVTPASPRPDPFDQEWYDVGADGNLIMESKTVHAPVPAPQEPPAAPDVATAPDGDGADDALEETLQTVNDSAKKAEQAAAQAWEAALVAADSAQTLTAAIGETEPHSADEPLPDVDDEFAAYDALTFADEVEAESDSADDASDGTDTADAENGTAASDDASDDSAINASAMVASDGDSPASAEYADDADSTVPTDGDGAPDGATDADDSVTLEETLQTVNDSAKKAEQAAAQAWEAALVAADSAQALTAALSETAPHSADEPLPDVDDEFAAYDALTFAGEAEADSADAENDAATDDDASDSNAIDATADDGYSGSTADGADYEAGALAEGDSADNAKEAAPTLEGTLQVVSDSAKKAEQAAAQAWEAALVAADSAQALTAALSEKTQHGADEPLPDVDDEFAAYDALTFADEGGAEADSAEAENDAATGDDASDGSAIDATANDAGDSTTASDNERRLQSMKTQLSLFERLRSLCEFLPEEHYDSFRSSHARLLMDYVISRLSGNVGLLQQATQRREEAGIAPLPENDETGIELVTHVVDDMLSLIEAVPDKNLRTAMNGATQALIEKLIAQ